MKTRLSPALAMLIFIAYACQSPNESKPELSLGIKSGRFQPGVIDTLVFHSSELYSFGDYAGLKPFFVRIWVPVKATNGESLRYGDLFSFKNLDSHLIALRDTLNKGYTDYVMHRLTRTIGDEDSTLKAKSAQMFDELMQSPIRSRYADIPEGKFPVIVYHHGYGGWGHENFLFAEHMAANGFIVIGANYEWPKYEGGWDKGNADMEHILKFAKTLSFADSTQIFGVGHSWGAQSLLYYDNAPKHPFQKIISLHTTMEGPFPMDTITKWWSTVAKVMLDSTRRTSPTLIFAPEKPSNDFLIFRKSKNADYHYVNVLNPIAHDGFISVDNLRYFVRGNYQPKEDSILEQQFLSYQEICKAIHEQLATSEIDWDGYTRLIKVE